MPVAALLILMYRRHGERPKQKSASLLLKRVQSISCQGSRVDPHGCATDTYKLCRRQVERKQAGKHVLLNYTAPAALLATQPPLRLTASAVGGSSFLDSVAQALVKGGMLATIGFVGHGRWPID